MCWTDGARAACRDCGGTLIDKLERLEGRDGYRPPREVRSAAKVVAFELLNAETTVAERRLFALVDCVACLLAHGGRYGSEETARLAFESVVGSSAAEAAVRVLVMDMA
ncbi:MAG: hypothetical protein DLM59_03870 [Pseudonocardiales bacterium]|nr:MAG: hypothetical protein DLM59_03870 [Pseudonocardiales bacterium]